MSYGMRGVIDSVAPRTPNKGTDMARGKEMIDPKTNQPLSDFTPQLPDDHPDADAVRMQDDKIKVGSAMGRHDAAMQLIETRENDRARAEQAEADRELIEKNNPLPEREYAMIPPDVYRAREQARVMAEAAVLGTSKTVPGGRFRVGDKWVNSEGVEVK